ncbi:hypothetical protein [Chondromyces crocatus]|uniref:Uncharacterized protein n=1 Tax=Chondromyces crocatus TaxID=52 RepID=A0A0K1EKD0_CHOCO|nr:hypothetical protein [Chondromyces crocatus]AKT41321.1 uncharacterized protein CMC5_054950 [Chondromyces crocatus]
MALRLPLSIKLTRRVVARRDLFCEFVQKTTNPSQADAAFAFHAFAFKADEHEFARAFLSQRTEFWLFRANQRAFCGDFLAVDMSSPWLAGRRVYVIELKQGMSIRIGSGAVGVQLRNAATAVRALARDRGLVGEDAASVTVAGDGAEVCATFRDGVGIEGGRASR